MGSIDFTDTRFVDPGFAYLATPEHLRKFHPDDGHRAVPVAVDGRAAPIDEMIAELVYLAWKLGLDTRGSCQEQSWGAGGLSACIAFMDMDDCQRFVGLLYGTGYDTEALEIGAWVEGPNVVGEVDFPLGAAPELVEALRSILGPLPEEAR